MFTLNNINQENPLTPFEKAGMIRSIFSAQSPGIVTLKRSEESMISLINSLDTSLSLSMTSQKVSLNVVTLMKFLNFFRTYQPCFEKGG